VGRPKQTKLDAVRFVAHRDNESKEFDSRREANVFVSSARRSSRVDPTYWKCRYWVLELSREPAPGEEHLDYENFSQLHFSEREAVLKGANPELLSARAEALRRASFERHWVNFRNESHLRQLPPESRRLALETVERFYERYDDQFDRREAKKEAKRKEEDLQTALAAIPTVDQLFRAHVDNRVASGHIQRNTAETYLYEASAFEIETTCTLGRKPLASTQVHDLSRAAFKEWFGVFAARQTRFGKVPTAKTCENVLSHLRAVGKSLKNDDDLSKYAPPFDVLDGMIEEIKRAKGKGDGWRNRHRLTNESVAKLIEAAQTDLEHAALALVLAGPRPPGETVALEWEHLENDGSGNLWWHVQASVIELVGGDLDVRIHTKTQDVDYRQLSIARRFVPWLEPLRGRSKFVLGEGDDPMRPSTFTDLIESLIERAAIGGMGISTYSLRHTVSDEIERILGRTARDLVLHGRRDRTTGSLHYSHAQRDRRRAELTFDGTPYAEHLIWATD
jgi:PAS domain-containing protein